MGFTFFFYRYGNVARLFAVGIVLIVELAMYCVLSLIVFLPALLSPRMFITLYIKLCTNIIREINIKTLTNISHKVCILITILLDLFSNICNAGVFYFFFVLQEFYILLCRGGNVARLFALGIALIVELAVYFVLSLIMLNTALLRQKRPR